jgi:nitroimidazol reductase NimA-like FMN-containing flavoprotein (pyridoxamine 5'-phosphate oxidase superfamily)
MQNQPRQLERGEIDELLALDGPARLATLHRDGFPHVTPLWFAWVDCAFDMASIADHPHLHRLRRNQPARPAGFEPATFRSGGERSIP